MNEDFSHEDEKNHRGEEKAGSTPDVGARAESGDESDLEELSAIVVDAAFHLHRGLGPGLLESVYGVVLAKMLQQRGLQVERQLRVPIVFEGCRFDEGFRADILVNRKLLLELKSVEMLLPLHSKQVLTYLRLLDLRLGLLINFWAATFKEGVKRVVNRHTSTASSTACSHYATGAGQAARNAPMSPRNL
jgi:GxxExxY protein